MKDKFWNLYYTLWAYSREWFYFYWNLRAKFYRVFPKRISLQQFQEAKFRGNILDQDDRTILTLQTKCNHRKGGRIVGFHNVEGMKQDEKAGLIAKALNKGTSPEYSVMKHQMMNGDFRIRCTRCGKTWTAPIRTEYATDREFYKAIEEYEAAKDFDTNNETSTSLQFRFQYGDGSDASEVPRKAMAARI